MDQPFIPSGILLVGSIPLASTEEVFTRVCSSLPQRLHAVPDGETGTRHNYIAWQLPRFPRETIYHFLGGVDRPSTSESKYTLESIEPTRYDEVALSSYADFVKLRAQGVIASDLLFQVCLPTPFNSIQGHVRPEFHQQLEPLYEERFLESLTRIVEDIPSEDLAVQWDLTFDTMALEYDRGRLADPRFKPHFSPVKQGILDRISRLCAIIPQTVKVAFHICYGDLRHKHFMEPIDTELLVELANDIIRTIGDNHPVEWIHIPVPKSRVDVGYFEALNALDLRGARLYLGLVHANDEEGTRERIRVAHSVYPHGFGVATECGMGRTPKEELESILRISKAVTAPRGPTKL